MDYTAAEPHTPRKLAWRTFRQGLLIDVAVALGLTLTVTFTSIDWTMMYWLGVAGSCVRTVLQSTVAYVVRRLGPLRLDR